ncbi:MAG TPA: alpha/beta fold hydrolase [Marinobacter sp.]|uniref:alpha/beta fold hydrolase n=1 Tax=Marinobacter sp. TaxID=50741 RepID=UPI002D7E51E4|nr:alpha/beta fold hydrolase [Marinobacter sp.]HET8802486.1 alpha/beta fold hydrolase [Marinobacter sp.]
MTYKREHWVTSGNLSLYAVAEGKVDATPLVLVHGYPDNHRIWDDVVEVLGQSYFIIRYDVRGAGRSEKPKRARDYRMALLARDLEAVVDAIIPDRDFHLAAHDWGAIQSWESVTSGRLQSRVASYTSISGPCLDHVAFWVRRRITDVFDGGTRAVAQQLARSWYVAFFQLPLLPELAWRAGLDRAWPSLLSRREGVTKAHTNTHQRSDGRYGVNLYRANIIPRLRHPEARHARCPVQIIIPTRDRYVGSPLFSNQVSWTGKLTRVELDAPHWVLLTDPGRVAGKLDQFISDVRNSSPVA